MAENLQTEEQKSSPFSQISMNETPSGGNELLDATQNAIIDAAENVSEALTLTEKPAPIVNKEVPLYLDVEFWVGMSFVVVSALIAKPLWRAVKDGLKNRINSIIQQIDEAMRLRDDAQKLLADYERKCRDLDQRVEQISEQSKKNIAFFREQEFKNLQRELDKKEAEVQARIESATKSAIDEINNSISSKAVNLAQQAIAMHLSKAEKIRLIDEAIVELDNLKK